MAKTFSDYGMPDPVFHLGQKVYHASAYTTDVYKPCPDCMGNKTWHVETPAGEAFEMGCGTCGGDFPSGSVKQARFMPHVRELTIGLVHFDTYDSEGQIRYMCQETGVGSGSVYYEPQLYSDHDSAMAEAKSIAKQRNDNLDKQNAENAEKARKKARRKPSLEKRMIADLKKEVAQLKKKLKEG